MRGNWEYLRNTGATKMMNEQQLNNSLLEQLDEQKALADRNRSALQDIREYDFDHDLSGIDYICLINIVRDALKEGV